MENDGFNIYFTGDIAAGAELEGLGMVCHVERSDAEVTSAVEAAREKADAETHAWSRTGRAVLGAAFVGLFFSSKDPKVLMIFNLLIALAFCHLLHRDKFGYASLFPDGFWTINRKAGAFIVLLYLVTALSLDTLFPRFAAAFAATPEMFGTRRGFQGPLAGFIYIICLPTAGILVIHYYDLVYVPKSGQERKGADWVALCAGCSLIVLDMLILSAFT
jgi:hypothetical protein